MPGRVVLGFLLLLLLVTAAGFVAFSIDMHTHDRRLAGRSKVVRLSTGPMEFAEMGSGFPVLVIHGSGGGFDQGLDMGGPLASLGYRLIAPSRFGYLGSHYPSRASPELQADAFSELIVNIGLDRAVIVGGSAGALSAMQLAIRHPKTCRALILLVPASYAPARKPNEGPFTGGLTEKLVRTVLQSDFLFWAAIHIAPETMTRLLLATEPAVIREQPLSELARIRAMLDRILPVSERADGLLLDMKTAGAPPPYPLSRIECPVLAVSAKDDLYGTAEAARFVAGNVADGRLILYETGGHILAGHSEEIWRVVNNFIVAHP